MIQKFLFSLLFLFSAHFLFAQDTIYVSNPTNKIVAKVLEINPEQVKYKLFSLPDGPLYIVDKDDIEKIVFADGHTETFNEPEEIKNTAAKPIRPVMVSLNTFDLMFGMITVNGEYYFPKTGVSLKVPVSVGLQGVKGPSSLSNYYNPDLFYYNRNRILTAGLGMLFYPDHLKHNVSYFTGFTFEYGHMITRMQESHYNYYYYPYYSEPFRVQYNWLGTGVVNGVLVRLSDRVNVGLSGILGLMVVNEHYHSPYTNTEIKSTRYYPMGRMEINFGFRFGQVK